MVSPVQKALSWEGNQIGRVTGTIKNALGLNPPDMPAIPPPLPPAQTPSAKPQRKSQQQSFLSGVAAAGLPGGGGGSQTGKSLLGS